MAFVNDADSGETVRNELSLLKSALFAILDNTFYQMSCWKKQGVILFATWKSRVCENSAVNHIVVKEISRCNYSNNNIEGEGQSILQAVKKTNISAKEKKHSIQQPGCTNTTTIGLQRHQYLQINLACDMIRQCQSKVPKRVFKYLKIIVHFDQIRST